MKNGTLEKNNIDIVIIGNIAFDTNYFNYNDKTIIKKNIGGACLYSALPASLFAKIGIVSNVGDDFDVDVFKNYKNINLDGLKIIENQKTTEFIQYYKDEHNRKNREVKENINTNLLVKSSDIPKHYLSAKYIHLTTNYPSEQLKLIKYIRKNSNAIISVDTIEGYSKLDLINEVYDSADIAFIDEKFTNLYNCKAPIKIIKNGKEGCTIIENNRSIKVNAKSKDNVVDKTGAGDCLNGSFIANLSIGKNKIDALKRAIDIATYSIDFYGMNEIYKYLEKR